MDEDEVKISYRTTERMLALSDAVFAFALTLLALGIELPAGLSLREFHLGLLQLLSKSVSYALSVIVIGVYWMAHQRMFRFIKCYDHRLLWLNLLFLLSITFVPPLTAIVREYGRMRVSVIIYTSSLILSTLLLAVCWQYVIRRPVLITKDLDAAIARYYTLRSLSYGGIYLITILVALFNPISALYVLLALFLIIPLLDRLRRPERA